MEATNQSLLLQQEQSELCTIPISVIPNCTRNIIVSAGRRRMGQPKDGKFLEIPFVMQNRNERTPNDAPQSADEKKEGNAENANDESDTPGCGSIARKQTRRICK